MRLSIIIVNYNVKYFLEHCLYSVQRAIKNIDSEIIVVDNNSTDNSIAYLTPRFQHVTFLSNTENKGFGKACNQGLQHASGDYILFLNPDTLVTEDAFERCIEELERDGLIGAIGVKMLDGSGKFLKESKRAFPSPLPSLYKLFGLSKLFPHSPVFSSYHLGHLDKNENHVVDVLSGAFMMIRKKVLEKTGGFDEAFFMYGEDIDLSYRIQQAGYKNLYLAKSPIVHFKGESTSKLSLNYVKMFYQAMAIFAEKHYGGSRKEIFIFFIHAAIWLRALISVAAAFVKKIGVPLVDGLLFWGSFWVTKVFWNNYIKEAVFYQPALLWKAFIPFSIIYILIYWFAGIYDKNGLQPRKFFRSSLIALVILLAAYSLLPEKFRFSRGIILAGSMLGFLFIFLLRLFLVKAGVLKITHESINRLPGIVAGREPEYHKILDILNGIGNAPIIDRVSIDGDEADAIGKMEDLPQLQKDLNIKIIFFCTGNISYSRILPLMEAMRGDIHFLFFCGSSNSIIGSPNGNSSGEIRTTFFRAYALGNPYNRRIKRLFDVLLSCLFILTFFLSSFLQKKPFIFFKNCFNVLRAKNTWVGYLQPTNDLPPLKPGIIAPNGKILPVQSHSAFITNHIDRWYASNFSALFDLGIIFRNYKVLDGS